MDDIRKVFILESTDLLRQMEGELLKLESSPDDTDALNAVFRIVHTIKGASGIVDCSDIERFTHKVEEVLDNLRESSQQITSGITNLMLQCHDYISHMVLELSGEGGTRQYTDNGVRQIEEGLKRFATASDSPITAETGSESAATVDMPDNVGEPTHAANWHISLRFAKSALANGFDPMTFISYLSSTGTIHYLHTLFTQMPEAATMNPEDCYAGFEIDFKTDMDRAGIEDVFEFVKDDCTINVLSPAATLQQYASMVAGLPEDNSQLGEILLEGGALTDDEHARVMQMAEDLSLAPAGQPVDNLQPQHPSRQASTIRVDTAKLDLLLDAVGELVISGASIRQVAERIKDRELNQSSSGLYRLIEDIREKSMSVRMMPIQDTFNRFKRVVRDICHHNGKDIALQVEGGETELDKTVIERIADPLMHIVRNAADHGIETAGQRASAGKPARANIMLRAYQQTGSVIIEVSDDGRGIDRQQLLKKAAASGYDLDYDNMTEQDALDLIFMPGLSTAQEVTNISGRGVGMDVVRKNVQQLKGNVQIESQVGQGTTVRISLPLTLAIIDGFLVRVGEAYYVVPMDMVQECLQLTAGLKAETHDRNHIQIRGTVLPYIKLSEVFQEPSRADGFEYILVVRHGNRITGLLVDELCGEVQTVVKALGRMYDNVEGLSGTTIMGDGTVALILDVQALVQQALRTETNRYD